MHAHRKPNARIASPAPINGAELGQPKACRLTPSALSKRGPDAEMPLR
jgi:hypothetical protein